MTSVTRPRRWIRPRKKSWGTEVNLRRAYIPHEILVGPARAQPDLWRVVAGCFTIVATAIMLSTVASTLIWLILQPQTPDPASAVSGLGRSPTSLLLLLGGFAFLTIGTALAARLFHNRSLGSVLGPFRAVARDFGRVLSYLFVLAIVVALLPPYDMGVPLTPNLPPVTWAVLLPLSLLALLIQTSAEEIIFRGYLQQQLAARFSSPLIWIGLPSALFAFGHYVPADAGNNAILVASWAGIFGLLTADLTARAGNLGPAIAVHFANNFSAIVLVSLPDTMSGLSLYTIDIDISEDGALTSILPIEFGMMILMWLTARLAIRR